VILILYVSVFILLLDILGQAGQTPDSTFFNDFISLSIIIIIISIK